MKSENIGWVPNRRNAHVAIVRFDSRIKVVDDAPDFRIDWVLFMDTPSMEQYLGFVRCLGDDAKPEQIMAAPGVILPNVRMSDGGLKAHD